MIMIYLLVSLGLIGAALSYINTMRETGRADEGDVVIKVLRNALAHSIKEQRKLRASHREEIAKATETTRVQHEQVDSRLAEVRVERDEARTELEKVTAKHEGLVFRVRGLLEGVGNFETSDEISGEECTEEPSKESSEESAEEDSGHSQSELLAKMEVLKEERDKLLRDLLSPYSENPYPPLPRAPRFPLDGTIRPTQPQFPGRTIGGGYVPRSPLDSFTAEPTWVGYPLDGSVVTWGTSTGGNPSIHRQWNSGADIPLSGGANQ